MINVIFSNILYRPVYRILQDSLGPLTRTVTIRPYLTGTIDLPIILYIYCPHFPKELSVPFLLITTPIGRMKFTFYTFM